MVHMHKGQGAQPFLIHGRAHVKSAEDAAASFAFTACHGKSAGDSEEDMDVGEAVVIARFQCSCTVTWSLVWQHGLKLSAPPLCLQVQQFGAREISCIELGSLFDVDIPGAADGRHEAYQLCSSRAQAPKSVLEVV